MFLAPGGPLLGGETAGDGSDGVVGLVGVISSSGGRSAVPAGAPGVAARVPRPAAEPARPVPVVPVVPDHGAEWRRRGVDAQEPSRWLGAGVRDSEALLVDQCRVVGIEPGQLGLVLSGRSVLLRLRGGETATSVWARIQEGEDRRWGVGKLSGRFRL